MKLEITYWTIGAQHGREHEPHRILPQFTIVFKGMSPCVGDYCYSSGMATLHYQSVNIGDYCEIGGAK